MKDSIKIWALVYHKNDYRQEKEGYFIKAYKEKPSILDLLDYMSIVEANEVIINGESKQCKENYYHGIFVLLEETLF